MIKKKFFNKLVRDKIPEVLKAKGANPEIEILTCEKYRKCLFEKLREECEEVIVAKNKDNLKEEIADVLEVIMGITKFEGIPMEEIEAIRASKKEKKGSFDMKIFLKSTQIV